jgi:hypothetical protein
MVDLDEMKQKWAEQDRKLEKSIQLNQRLLRATKLDKAESEVHRLTVFLGLGAAVWGVIVVALGNFVYEHLVMPQLALPAGMVDLFSIGMLVSYIVQLAMVREVDYGSPVAAIQRQTERVRVLRIRTVQWGLAAGMVVWAPFMVVMSNLAFGLEHYSALWLWTNVGLGVGVGAVVFWVSKRLGARLTGFPFVQRLMNDVAGRSLISAMGFLASVREFDRE